MVDGLTEGLLFYSREEYNRALPKLKEELKLALQLDAHGIDPEIEDPRVHKILIDSIEGELPVFDGKPGVLDGQPGVLDLVCKTILHQKREEVVLELLSVLKGSSNEGVRFIAGMLQAVIEEGPSQIRYPRGIDPYRTASTTLDTQSLFLLRFGDFLLSLNERWHISSRGLEQAIALNSEARAGFEEGTLSFARTLVNKASAHEQLARRRQDPIENLTEAIALYSEAKGCFEEDTPDYARQLMNEAIAHQQLAELGQKPIKALNEAIELHGETKAGFEEGTPDYARPLMNEAIAHQQLAELGQKPIENLTEAIALYSEARAGFEEGTPSFTRTLANEANAHLLLAELEQNPTKTLTEAIELYGEAKAGFEEGTSDYARTLMNEASAHRQLAELRQKPIKTLTEAIELYGEAKACFEEGTSDYARTLTNEANARHKLAELELNPERNYVEAEVLYTDARELFDASIDYESLRKVNINLANLYLSMGDLVKAFESYERAIEAIEEMRETVRFRDTREEFFAKHISVYHSTVLLALTLNKPEEALKYAERAKSRIFLDQLADTQVTGDIPEELTEQEQELKEKIAQLRRELDRDGRGVADFSGTVPAEARAMSGGVDEASQTAMQTGVDSFDGIRRSVGELFLSPEAEDVVEKVNEGRKKREEKEEALKEAKRELDEVHAEIREHDPEAYTLRSVDVASLGEIRAGLGADEQLLEYFVAEEKLVIFLVDDQELATEVVSLEERGPAASLESVIDEHSVLVESKQKGEVTRWQELGEVLYELLIAPVEEELRSENLTIVPHGGLHVVPFAALYDGEGYLVERYKLRVLANASTLRFLDKSEDDEVSDALVVGDPREKPNAPDLDHAREEAKMVAELHDGEALIGPAATKAEVEARIETADLAHLACHAQYDADTPAYSSVVLADSELLLEELLELEVQGELVTLAACETAYGEVSRSDEVQSLTRGFQFAGASGVIGTLWRVADEATPELFREFYTADGNRAERLRQAQLSFIQAEDLRAHPYFWSGFQLYGIS